MTPRGFTLVELLVAVVIISILAAIAMKVGDYKKKAYVAVVKSDVRNVVTAQESYMESELNRGNGLHYASSVKLLTLSKSPNVTLIVVGDEVGYSVLGFHTLANEVRCGFFYGKALPIAPATVEGVLACEPKGNKGGGKGKP